MQRSYAEVHAKTLQQAADRTVGGGDEYGVMTYMVREGP